MSWIQVPTKTVPNPEHLALTAAPRAGTSTTAVPERALRPVR